MSASTPPAGKTPIFLVAGQSNALGLGQYSPSPLPASIVWRGFQPPRGIGVSFAERYLERSGQAKVIIAQCSVGATSIYEWQPGGGLFEQCLGILGNIRSDTLNTHVAGFLFWQGEYDAHEQPTTPWSCLFKSIVRALRFKLDDNRLPVVFCQLSSNESFGQASVYPYWEFIKTEQARVDLPHAAMVQTDDITDIADSVHVGADGLETIGHRMAETYFQLVNP